VINTLFTSAGRRVELVRAFRQAYSDLGLEGHIIATDIDPLAPALQEADRAFLVPRFTEKSYLDTLVRLCQREEVKLVFPLIDPEILILARHREDLERTGARVAVVSSEAAMITADKWLTHQFLERLAVPTPRTWLPEMFGETPPAFPLVVKPRTGSAGRQVFTVHNARELSFFAEYVSQPILQEHLPGPEITNDLICDLKGKVLAVVSRQRIEVRWGEVTKGKTVSNSEIIKHCVTIAEGLAATGPITVQCLLREGKPFFTEINARFAGGVPLAIAAGVKAAHWYLAMAAGIEVEVPPLGSCRSGIYLTRFDDSFFLTEEDYARIESRRL
jgi:carbamoyl-phosphate synthase large subunit